MGHINDSQTSSIKNVLFLGGGKRVSLLERFEQAALKEGIQLKFFCYELEKEVHLGNRATVIKGKPFKDMSVADLDMVCVENDIDLVVPLMDAAVPLCSLYKEHNPKAWMSVPEYETAWACYDKLAFVEWIKENNLSHLYPWPEKYPWFAKSRYGYGSRDQCVVKTKRQVEKLEGEYVFQQLLNGPEYTVDCYVNQRGTMISAVPRRRLLVVRGEVENSVTVDNSWLQLRCEYVLSGRGFAGPVTVQFMGNKLIEINARFGGGVILSIEAGADYPQLMLREMLGRPLFRPTYEPNVLMLRSYRETYYRSYENT